MIEKLNEKTIWSENWAMRQEAPSNYELMEKINEIIDCLNEQEKINSYRVTWTHQDSITNNNIQ